MTPEQLRQVVISVCPDASSISIRAIGGNPVAKTTFTVGGQSIMLINISSKWGASTLRAVGARQVGDIFKTSAREALEDVKQYLDAAQV